MSVGIIGLVAGAILLGMLAAGVPLFYALRLMAKENGDLRTRLVEEPRVFMERISALEHQVDELHAQGLQITPPPVRVPEPGPAPLPLVVQKVLEGFEDDDARDELAELARHRLAEGTAPELVAAELVR